MYNIETAAFILGKKKAPFVLKNAVVLNVYTNEWMQGDIALCGETVLGVGSYEGEEETDLGGRYVVPGFMDAHLHLESTLLNPSQLIMQASAQGTTTFIVDPHEAANVSGLDGIRFILEDSGKCRANVYVMMPSCVPSVAFEQNGAAISAEDMESMLTEPRILGLGEVMDVPSVLQCEEEMRKKLELFRREKRMIDGHGGSLGDKEGACCRFAGIRTDHECTTYEDAMREVRNGIHILIREGTAARNLEDIVKGIVKNHTPTDMFSFCTDDKHIEDIIRNGHISYNIRKAISLGICPEEAYKMASCYTARCYGLSHLGAVAPGKQADLVVLDDYEKVKIHSVYHKGRLLDRQPPAAAEVPDKLLNTVHLSGFDRGIFRMTVSEAEQPVIEVMPGEILTDLKFERVPEKNGLFQPNDVYQKICVFERHRSSGAVGRGILKGFSLQGGAVASTVGHDSHNLIVIGDDDEAMETAVRELAKCQGGYTVVRKGEKPLTQPLEIMGLMTKEPYGRVAENLKKMKLAAQTMGIPESIDPFITMSFLALPVIPKVRITPLGIYDTEKNIWYQIG